MNRKMLHFGRLTRAAVLLVIAVSCLSGEAFSSWPDFWLSTDCFSGSAPGAQTAGSVAFDGTNFLVVWEDDRNIREDIFGARVSLQGEILDPVGIPICTYQSDQSGAKVAWGGENYLVVWQDWRNGNMAIYGARVNPDGNVLDPNGFLISGGWEWTLYPDVAWDGTNFFVVWSHGKLGTFYDIYGTRITPDGEVLDPGGILICADSLPEYYPSIAYNGSVYLVAWEHNQW